MSWSHWFFEWRDEDEPFLFFLFVLTIVFSINMHGQTMRAGSKTQRQLAPCTWQTIGRRRR
jgi:hypothetical protein